MYILIDLSVGQERILIRLQYSEVLLGGYFCLEVPSR